MAAKAFHIEETPVLSPESSKALVLSLQTTPLSSARQAKLKRLASTAREAYQKSLPLLARIK